MNFTLTAAEASHLSDGEWARIACLVLAAAAEASVWEFDQERLWESAFECWAKSIMEEGCCGGGSALFKALGK